MTMMHITTGLLFEGGPYLQGSSCAFESQRAKTVILRELLSISLVRCTKSSGTFHEVRSAYALYRRFPLTPSIQKN